MPFNLLLVPLLAGYLYLAKSNLRSYWTAQLQKEQLLFSAATYGLLFLIMSRSLVLLALATDVGRQVANAVHAFAPFDYVGTSVGTLALAVIAWNFGNAFVSEKTAGHWLYHRSSFDSLTGMFWQSAIGVRPNSAPTGFLFIWTLAVKVTWVWLRGLYRLAMQPSAWQDNTMEPFRLFKAARSAGVELAGFEQGNPLRLMLSMKDAKVIVGLVVELPALRPDPIFVTILPLWTGYRDSSTKRVIKTVDYKAALDNADDPLRFSRVIRTADIATATIWDESAFVIPEVDEAPIDVRD